MEIEKNSLLTTTDTSEIKAQHAKLKSHQRLLTQLCVFVCVCSINSFSLDSCFDEDGGGVVALSRSLAVNKSCVQEPHLATIKHECSISALAQSLFPQAV